MNKLPKIICSSVIRSSKQGNSHGGIYIVDLENENFKQVVDWNDQTIDWNGRGADRGLRGIAFYEDKIICAASDEVFFFNKDFKIVKSIRNRYLKDCHEIYIYENKLYLTSTGYDSILVFNLKTESFDKGFTYRKKKLKKDKFYKLFRKARLAKMAKHFSNKNSFAFTSFDPQSKNGPNLNDTSHINNVFVKNGIVHFSGTRLEHLFKINTDGKSVASVLKTGGGTHNVSLYKNYHAYNNTEKDSVTIIDSENSKDSFHFKTKKYKSEELLYTNIGKDHARQGFGRGLCFYQNFIIRGSSPSTITVHSLNERKLIKSINLTLDIRNAIHGLEVFPFE